MLPVVRLCELVCSFLDTFFGINPLAPKLSRNQSLSEMATEAKTRQLSPFLFLLPFATLNTLDDDDRVLISFRHRDPCRLPGGPSRSPGSLFVGQIECSKILS
jgi:hypothetical protein